ncbi:MAG: endonuclease NucS [Propionibacteriaceae bacterium]|jgi:RecB family endonuclease NucS|nr:endonuclease NucS [Propionibacteriaceae bacterium]
MLNDVRILIAKCQVDYSGRLTAHLPYAKRLIIVKTDGAVSIHADDRAYKPLNWMSPPCRMTVRAPESDEPDVTEVWEVVSATGDRLLIAISEIFHDHEEAFETDPGLEKDGVEAHLQELLAANTAVFGAGYTLVQREYPTPIGPVDILLRAPNGRYTAVEVKRRGEIAGVEQLTRYLDLMRRDPLLGDVAGVFAAQVIKPQARTLAADRGISCVLVDYDALRGLDDPSDRLF